MNYHVDSDGIRNFQYEILKTIDLFQEQLYGLFDSSKELVWEGTAYNESMNSFYELLNQLKNIPEVLELLADFTDTALDGYHETLEEIKTKFEEIMDLINNEKLNRSGF